MASPDIAACDARLGTLAPQHPGCDRLAVRQNLIRAEGCGAATGGKHKYARERGNRRKNTLNRRVTITRSVCPSSAPRGFGFGVLAC